MAHKKLNFRVKFIQEIIYFLVKIKYMTTTILNVTFLNIKLTLNFIK